MSSEDRDGGLGDGIRRATAACGTQPFSLRPKVFGVSESDAVPKQESESDAVPKQKRVEFAGLA
jgi:hypothetical protein